MKKILVVDDEREVRESLERVLVTAGYEVKTLASAREALSYIKDNPVGLLLVDLSMPGMSGEDLLKQLHKEGNLPPSLVITAMAPWQTLGVIEYGIGYIRKPIDNDILFPIIESMMRKESKNEEVSCAG